MMHPGPCLALFRGVVGAKWEQISVTGPSAPAVPATAPALARNVDGYGSAIRLIAPRAGGLARRVRRWARDERDVYVYFDNDVKVGAPFDALSLMRQLPSLLSGRSPALILRSKPSVRRDLHADEAKIGQGPSELPNL